MLGLGCFFDLSVQYGFVLATLTLFSKYSKSIVEISIFKTTSPTVAAMLCRNNQVLGFDREFDEWVNMLLNEDVHWERSSEFCGYVSVQMGEGQLDLTIR